MNREFLERLYAWRDELGKEVEDMESAGAAVDLAMLAEKRKQLANVCLTITLYWEAHA